MIFVVGAMPEELAFFKTKLTDSKEVSDHVTVGVINRYPVAVIQTGIGKVAAASRLMAEIVNSGSPQAVINIGSCGSLIACKVGDVFTALDAAYHDVDVTALGEPLGKLPGCPRTFHIHHHINKLIKQSNPDTLIKKAHAVLTGDSFISGVDEVARLKAQYSALGSDFIVDMEAAALAQVCHSLQLGFGVIKTVSDVALQESPADFEENLAKVADLPGLMAYNTINFMTQEK